MAAIQDKLEEYLRLADAATPGPWHTVDRIWGAVPTYVIAGSHDPHLGTPICDAVEIMEWEEGEEPLYTQSDADMEFIAMARTAVPALCHALAHSLAKYRNLRKLCKEKLGELPPGY